MKQMKKPRPKKVKWLVVYNIGAVCPHVFFITEKLGKTKTKTKLQPIIVKTAIIRNTEA